MWTAQGKSVVEKLQSRTFYPKQVHTIPPILTERQSISIQYCSCLHHRAVVVMLAGRGEVEVESSDSPVQSHQDEATKCTL